MEKEVTINEDEALLIWKTVKNVFQYLPRNEQHRFLSINTKLLSIIDDKKIKEETKQ